MSIRPKTERDRTWHQQQSFERKRIEAEASARRGRNGRTVTTLSLRTDAIADLRHAKEEIERAITEVEHADMATPVHFAASMDAPLARANLARGFLESTLRRMRYGKEGA